MKKSDILSITGNTGKKIKSDCQVTLELKKEGGIIINLQSKVEAYYGSAIKKLTEDILVHFDIKNANIEIIDHGALDWVIAARVESAIKKLISTDKEYLLPLLDENKYKSEKERFRFSRLYLPGNSPKMMINAGLHNPEGIILDLEDSVALDKKHEAAFLVRNALRNVDFYGAERMVRINQFPKGVEDLKYIVPHNVHLILVPKCENPHQIVHLENEIINLKKKHNIEDPIFLMPIIESALGVEKAFEIAGSSQNIVALAIGLEDLTADLGVKRTAEASESLYARTRVVNACKAARIQAIDSVFSDVEDSEGLIKNVQVSKSLGFEGMGCIHPRQIPIIHKYYAPDADEIEKAKRIFLAFEEATAKGLGVVSLGSKMIDPPVVKRAVTTINLALKLGLLPEDWAQKKD